ncbi:MAG TPA: thioredoxin domain-containing protein [Terriglobales bacterium]|nr:thioredoxin domain-containing protein [Terriglobales bacterium]
MQRKIANLILVLTLAGVSGAQQKVAAKHAATTQAEKTSPSAGGVNLPSEETVNSFMQQTFGYDPQLSWKVTSIKPAEARGLAEVSVLVTGPQGVQNLVFYTTADAKHAIAGDLMPFGAKPFEETREKLAKGVNGPTRGPANSKIMIVEFSDLQCPHCKQAQPVVDKLLADEPQAKFVFQNFPLPSHDWAAKAAAYADCVGRASTDAFWKFVQKTYDDQANITSSNADEKLTAIADASGVKGADIAACAAKPETTARLEHSLALGKEVGVNGTPTLFVNGRRIGNLGIPQETLKQLVDFEGKQP